MSNKNFVNHYLMEGGIEQMLRKMFSFVLVVGLFLSLSTLCFAGATKPIAVTATIPTVSQSLSVVVTPVTAGQNGAPDSWGTGSSSQPIAFGTLSLDPTYHIFKSVYYYSVDVGVTDNSGVIWTLTHTRTSMMRDANNNLDGNVNVTFMKQTSDTAATQLTKLSYSNSNNITYNKTQLAGGWLRIYYGIGTGSGDAPGVTPIGMDKATGTYTGQVTLTLAP